MHFRFNMGKMTSASSIGYLGLQSIVLEVIRVNPAADQDAV